MSGWKMSLRAALGLLFLVGMSGTARAQDAGGRPDPAQMRQRFMDRIKEQLGANDDEWKVLQPKIEKVFQAGRDARGGGFGMFGGRRGGGGADQPAETPVAKAAQDLRQALDNKDTKAEDILAKLKTLRETREKAREEQAKAQKELKEVLTQRQEAVLVLMGLLE
jgi:TolA-binding protein